MKNAEPFGLFDEGLSLFVGERLPPLAQAFADLCVVHLWLLFADLASLDLRPDHEGVHRSLDVVGHFLALGRVRVRRSAVGVHLQGAERRALPRLLLVDIHWQEIQSKVWRQRLQSRSGSSTAVQLDSIVSVNSAHSRGGSRDGNSGQSWKTLHTCLGGVKSCKSVVLTVLTVLQSRAVVSSRYSLVVSSGEQW